MEKQRQGITLFTAISALVAILVIVQLWLLAASVDALLSGQSEVLIPAAAASWILFLASGGLLLHALNFDRKSDQP